MDNEPIPVTSADVQDLRGAMVDVKESVDNLAERQRVTDELVAAKADRTTVAELQRLEAGRQSNRRGWRIAVAIGALALVVAFVVLGLVAKANHKQNDRQDATIARLNAVIAQQDADRKDRSRGSCIQFNVKQQSDRDAYVSGSVEALRQVATGAQAQDFIDAYEAALRANAPAKFPYRDCTQAGIDAFLENPPPDPNGG